MPTIVGEPGDEDPVDHGDRGPRPDWRTLLRDYPRRTVPSKHRILRQGNSAVRVVALCAGTVKLVRTLPDGRTTIVGVRFPGSVLGVGAALIGAPEPLSVVTLAPAEIVEVPSSEFARLVRRNDELSWHLHLEHCRELARELEQAAGLACLSARERLLEFLRLVERQVRRPAGDPGPHVELPLRDWELAQLLAITPQWMCGLMRELAANGRLMKVQNRWHLVR